MCASIYTSTCLAHCTVFIIQLQKYVIICLVQICILCSIPSCSRPTKTYTIQRESRKIIGSRFYKQGKYSNRHNLEVLVLKFINQKITTKHKSTDEQTLMKTCQLQTQKSNTFSFLVSQFLTIVFMDLILDHI